MLISIEVDQKLFNEMKATGFKYRSLITAGLLHNELLLKYQKVCTDRQELQTDNIKLSGDLSKKTRELGEYVQKYGYDEAILYPMGRLG